MSQATQTARTSKSIVQWGLIALLAALIAIVALPGYLGGQWPWSAELPVPHIQATRSLIDSPLPLEGWEASVHQDIRIAGDRWSLAEYRRSPVGAATDGADESFVLLMRPQMSGDQQPEVEWVDLRGSQGWKVSDRHTVKWSLPATSEIEVTTRYMRGIDERNTFAVMQWYGWPTGGHFAPGRWFWADQGQQWRQRQRMPWVAVSILLPIEPVGDIRPHTETVTAIAQTVQQSLLTHVFGDE